MNANYSAALKAVLHHEGGYVNHPRDPGGATNKGVTQRVYDAYRDKIDKPRRSVKQIESAEVAEIYRKQYWEAVRGDDLPAGVDYAVFDFAVNSGVSRAAKYLQAVVGVAQDGQIGMVTIAAAKACGAAVVIDRLCDKRLGFMRSLPIFSTFGRGWTARVQGVRAFAKGLLS